MRRKLILIRGPSGCGKSTYAKRLERDCAHDGFDVAICSADDFFVKRTAHHVEGRMTPAFVDEHVFDPAKLGQAHAECLCKVMELLGPDNRVVIVDNTFVRLWELRNYLALASMKKCDVEVREFRVETVGQLKACAARNVHKVPAEVVARMAMEFEPYGGAVVVKMEET